MSGGTGTSAGKRSKSVLRLWVRGTEMAYATKMKSVLRLWVRGTACLSRDRLEGLFSRLLRVETELLQKNLRERHGARQRKVAIGVTQPIGRAAWSVNLRRHKLPCLRGQSLRRSSRGCSDAAPNPQGSPPRYRKAPQTAHLTIQALRSFASVRPLRHHHEHIQIAIWPHLAARRRTEQHDPQWVHRSYDCLNQSVNDLGIRLHLQLSPSSCPPASVSVQEVQYA